MNNKCKHQNTEIHKHGRKNYPFGKKSKPVFTGVKKCTDHCKDCDRILHEWKNRGSI